jgi:hypothetical protein
MDILKIKSQIKSPYFNVILKISKSSKNDLKSDFVKSSIKSLNTLAMTRTYQTDMLKLLLVLDKGGFFGLNGLRTIQFLFA